MSHQHRVSRARRAFTAVATVVVMFGLVLGPAAAAVALPNEYVCDGAPPAGFWDVDPLSPHARDIDCLKAWGIATGTSATTYDPTGEVTRWQMALFLTRLWGGGTIAGPEPGFTDVGHLTTAAQEAIGHVAALAITTGTSPTTFAPDESVSRWQMALFLTRFLRAQGLVLPDGADQGFTDIGHLPQPVQVAINQIAQMGLTSGTSPTTFAPDAIVTREQMASFIMRTFKVAWSIGLRLTDSCTPPVDPVTGQPPVGAVCQGSIWYPADETFLLSHSWGRELPFPSAADEAAFNSSGTRVEVDLDGAPVQIEERRFETSEVVIRYFVTVVRGGLSGTHAFEVRWYYNGVLTETDITTVDFS